MAAKSAPAPVNPFASQVLALLIFAVGLALIATFVPKVAVHEFNALNFRSPFRVATSLPVVGNIYDPRDIGQILLEYPPIANGLAGFTNPFGPPKPPARSLVPKAVPPVTHLLWNAGISFAIVLLLVGIVPPIIMRRRNSALHGSARWNNFPTRFTSSLRRTRYGIVLAQHHGQLLIHGGNQSVLALGPPGEGKTYGIAIPTLRKSWPWSAIIFDPTRELATDTAEDRRAFGKVFIFDPAASHTHRFNPLGGVAASDIDKIKQILTPLFDSGAAKDGDTEYFLGRATVIATAACAFMIENDHADLASVLSFMRNPQWQSPDEPFKAMKASSIPYVQQVGTEFAGMADKTRSPLLGTFTDIFEVFASDSVKNATSGSDFSAEDFKQRDVVTSLYLVVREADIPRLAPLMRLVLARLTDELMLEKPKRDERPPILMLIDELPLLRAPFMQTKPDTMRKYGIRSLLMAQTLSQITRLYGPNQSLGGTCDVKVFFATEDEQTQKMAERIVGAATQFDLGYDSDGDAAASSEKRRPLMYGQEFGMLRDRVVITKKGEHPIKAQKITYNDRRFKKA